MQKEKIDRANEIMNLIEENKRAVELLEEFSESGGTIYKRMEGGIVGYVPYSGIDFEPWEIRLIIHNKKQRIAALEKELEAL